MTARAACEWAAFIFALRLIPAPVGEMMGSGAARVMLLWMPGVTPW